MRDPERVSLRRWLADHFRSTPPGEAHGQLEELTRFVIARGLRLPRYDDLLQVLDVHHSQRRGSELLTLTNICCTALTAPSLS